MEAMTLPLPYRAHSGLHAGIARWARSMLRGIPISLPDRLPQAGEVRFASCRGDFHGKDCLTVA